MTDDEQKLDDIWQAIRRYFHGDWTAPTTLAAIRRLQDGTHTIRGITGE